VSATFAVETGSHRDAVTLLRVLSGYNAWTIQLGEQRWLVVGRADTTARESSARAAVEAWAEQNGLLDVTTLLGDDVPAVARGVSNPLQ
jgi:hypothetical protein